MSWSTQRNQRLHALLPWQIYALAAMMGLFAAQYFAPALTMFFLLVLGMPTEAKTRTRWRVGSRMALLFMAFALAWFYACAQLPHTTIYGVLHSKEEASPSPLLLLSSEEAQLITGLVTAVEGLPDQRLRIYLDNVQLAQNAVETLDHTSGHGIRLVWTWEKPDLEHGMRPMVGQRIQVTLKVKNIDGLANPDSFDIERFWANKGFYYRAWSKGKSDINIVSEPHHNALWREALRLRIERSLHTLARRGFSGIGHIDNAGDIHDVALSPSSKNNEVHAPKEKLHMAAASVIMALLFGDRYAMDSRLLEYFAHTDLLHTLALSGQHLVIAGFFASLVIFFIRRQNAHLFYHITRPKLFYILCLPCAAFYLWLGDAPPSLIRASTMLLVWTLITCISNRQATLLDALLCALTTILIISPLSIYDLGMQLSSLAVAALAASLLVTQHCMGRLSLQRTREAAQALQQGKRSTSLRKELRHTQSLRSSFHAYIKLIMHTINTKRHTFLPKVAYAIGFLAISSTLIQLILLPVQLMVFAKASPWFLLNIPWIPLTDVFLLPLSFVGMLCHSSPEYGLFFPLHIMGDICFYLAMHISLGMTLFLEYLNEIGLLDMPALWRPHWTTAIGYGGLVLCALVRLGRQRLPKPIGRVALASALLFLTGFGFMLKDAYDDHLRMTVFDVGMGQAVYIRTPENVKVMIDGGGFFSNRFDTGRDIVARALTDNQWPRLDMVINTHPDNDHVRGLIHLLHAFPVNFYGYNGDDNAKNNTLALKKALQDAKLRATPLMAGMTLSLGPHLDLEVLYPPKSLYDAGALYGAGNDASLVTRLVYTGLNTSSKGQGLAMLCGDIEKKGLEEFLRYAKDSELDLSAEVLIVPHHGSKSSYFPALYDAVQPRVAIASCAKNHRHNYPNQEIVDEFARRHIPLLDTGKCGAIHCTWDILDNEVSQGHIHYERQSKN